MVGLTALREYRKNRQLSQEALARELGVTSATIHRWETGRREPRAAARQRIAEHTGIPLYLLVQQPQVAAE